MLTNFISKDRLTSKSRLYSRFSKSVRSQSWFRIRFEKSKRIASPKKDKPKQSRHSPKEKKEGSPKIKSSERPKTSKKSAWNISRNHSKHSDSSKSNERKQSKIEMIKMFQRRRGITKLFDTTCLKQREKKKSTPANLSMILKKSSKMRDLLLSNWCTLVWKKWHLCNKKKWCISGWFGSIKSKKL